MAKKVEAGKGKRTPTYPRCGAHRKYKGLHQPGTNCPVCWEIYRMRMGLTAEEEEVFSKLKF